MQRRAALALSPDGRQFLLGLTLHDAATLQEVRRYQRTSQGFTGSSETRAVAFSPDGKRFLSGDSDGLVRLWDMASGKELAHVFAHTNKAEVLSVAIFPDGRSALSGGIGWIGFESIRTGLPGGDHVVRLWSLPK